MKRKGSILVLISLILLLVGCSSGAAQPPTRAVATVTHIPTRTVPSGTLLYQADWSQGLAALGNPPGWKIVHGLLQSDTGDNDVFTLPYLPSVPNYAFEVRFQIVSVPQNGGTFELKADQTQDKDGYNAGILNLLSTAPHNEFANPQIQVYLNPMEHMDARMVTSDYEPGSGWHIFRVEVQGPRVVLLDNGLKKSFATSTVTQALSNGPLRLESAGAAINVSSVRILAL